MTKGNQGKAARTKTTILTHGERIGHWGRIAVMCLSGGFILPNAITEYDDIVKIDAGSEAKTKEYLFCPSV
jgi:hypothetical protein